MNRFKKKWLYGAVISFFAVFLLLEMGAIFGETSKEIILSNTTIEENASKASTIGNLSVEGEGFESVTYSLPEGGGEDFPFEIIGTQLVSNAVFDYETLATYDLTIRATLDTDESIDESFTITIIDVNEAVSIIEEGPINVEIDEDDSLSGFPLTLHAEDFDNDEIIWSITTSAAMGVASATGTGTSQTISYTPDEDYNGTDSFGVMVSDGKGKTDTITINVTIKAVNDAPVNTELPTYSGTMKVGEVLNATTGMWNDIKDGEAAASISYSYSWQRAEDASGTNIEVIGATGDSYTLTTADNSQYIRVAITATDSGTPEIASGVAYSEWQQVINIDPVITEGAAISINMDEDSMPTAFSLTLNATDTDGDELTWSIATAATNGTASAVGTGTSKAISYMPNEDYNGTDSFIVQVSDGNNGVDLISVNVTIAAINDAPVNTVAPSIAGTIHNGQTVTAVSGTWDDEADNSEEITYTYGWQRAENSDGTNTVVIADATSSSYTLTADDNDQYIRLMVMASDTVETVIAYSTWYEVINASPVIQEGTETAITTNEDTQVALTLNATDYDGDIISWEIATEAIHGAAAVSDSNTGTSQVITYTPTADYNGSDVFNVKTTDINGGEAVITVNMTVKSVNDIPTMTDIADLAIDEDTIGTPTFSIGDIEDSADDLTITFVSSDTALFPNANISISDSGTERTLSLTPAENRSGSGTLSVTVTDSNGASVTKSFEVTVSPINDAPELSAIADRTIEEDSNTGYIGVSIGDIDSDADSLIITASSDNESLIAESGMVISHGTGYSQTLYIEPIANISGTASITVVATDGELTDTEVFEVTVSPVNDAPTISEMADILIIEDSTSGEIAFTIGDVDDDIEDLTVSATATNTSMFPRSSIVLGGTEENRTLTLTPVADKNGSSQVTVSVKDSEGLVTSETFNITVQSVNDIPIISSVSDCSTNEDTMKSITISVTDEEDNDEDLTLSFSSDNETLVSSEDISITVYEDVRTIKITPKTNLSGIANITITVTDAEGGSADTQFALTVNALNDEPSFTKGEDIVLDEDDGAYMEENWATDLETGGAEDEGSQSLEFTLTNDHEALFSIQPVLSETGTLTFTPADDANGSAIVYVIIKDSDGAESTAQNFTITINPVNDAPTATGDAINLDGDEDKAYKGALIATDIEDDDLEYTIITNGTLGSVEITDINTGAYKYTPYENQYGEDTFTYKVNDGEYDSNIATITITIEGVNDAPVALGESISTDEDEAITGNLVASDIDSSNLTYYVVNNTESGTLTLNSDTGEYTYTPYSNTNGTDRFTFKVYDGYLYSNIVMQSITINAVNDAPTAYSEALDLYENNTLNGVLKANDIENNSLTYTIVSSVSHGTLEIDEEDDTKYTYTPTTNYVGEDSFTFKANDGITDSAIATVTIDVKNTNYVPTIEAPETYTTSEDTTLTSNFSADDLDGDELTYSIVSSTIHGSIALTNTTTGAFTYTPASNYSGTDMVTIKVSDGSLFSNIEIRNITVTEENDAPVAYDQFLETSYNTGLSGQLVAYDQEGDSLTYSSTMTTSSKGGTVSVNLDGTFTYTPAIDYSGSDSFTFSANDGLADSNVATITLDVHGGSGDDDSGISGLVDMTMEQDTEEDVDFTVTGFTGTVTLTAYSSNDYLLGDEITESYTDGTGTITLDPKDYKCGKTVITVVGSGSEGGADTDSFILTVTRVNYAPTANDKTLDIDENTVLNEFVLGTDLNGDSMTYAKVTGPSHGTLVFGSNGIFTYTPNENYYGTDTFTYSATDGEATSAEGTVTINIRQIEIEPTAVSDAIATDEDTVYTGTLEASDAHNETLTYSVVDNGDKGYFEITDTSTGDFTYTPNSNRTGSDTFKFKVTNESGLTSDTATITVTINKINDKPVPTALSIVTDEEQSISSFLSGYDVEGNTFTYELVDSELPAKGTITLDETDGSFIYIPSLNETGEDSFQFILKESDTFYSDSETVTITINPVNDAPTAVESSITVNEDGSYSGELSSLVTDVDEDDTQTFTLIQNGSLGTANIAADGTFTYTPDSDENGMDYFTFKTTDSGGLESNVDQVTVNITPINDAPTITEPSTWTINEDSSDNKFEFTVGDIEDNNADLIVTGASDNTALIPNENISFGGSSSERWIQVTPIDSVTGSAVMTITVSDSGIDGTLTGESLTAITTLTITVVDVDDKPMINGSSTNNRQLQSSVTIDEDTSTEAISFTVDDEESGGDLTITLTSGNTSLLKNDNIVLSGSDNNRSFVATPEADQSGSAKITVSVSDGNSTTTAYVDLTVLPVNDAPVVTPPSEQSINEDMSTDILYFTLSDIDNDVEDITMTGQSSDESIVPSSGIVINGNGEERTVQVTPNQDANGTVQITLIGDDGETVNPTGSGIFTVTVVPKNDAPTIESMDDVTIDEDTSSDEIFIEIDDIDSELASLTLSAISGNNSLIDTDGIIFGETDGDKWVKLTPNKDQNGKSLITIKVSDGDKTTNESFYLTVNPINDAPTISAISDQTVLEDGTVSTITFTVGDVDDDVSDLTITNGLEEDLAIESDSIVIVGNGIVRTADMTVEPNMNGAVEIELIVTDTGNLTSSSIFTINVIPVNDIPSFTKGSDESINENAGPQTITGWATNIDKGNVYESEQTLSFIVSTDNDELFSVMPAIDGTTGDLTYTPAENANGVANVSVYLKDDGGTSNGGVDQTAISTFKITIDAVNNQPSFDIGANQEILEDAGAQTINNWATNISTGASNEAGQNLIFLVSNDHNALFSSQPAINSEGKLTYTAADNAYGSATVTVTLKDDGGTAKGGGDTSATTSFTITVEPVNDRPTFDIEGDQSVKEDVGAQSILAFATDISSGESTYESDQTLTFTITNDNNDLFTVQPNISEDGTLTYTPADDAYGSATVTVVLRDSGGTANGGIDTLTKTFNIMIASVNDEPTFVQGENQEALEDAGLQSINNWATSISKGEGNESEQTLEFIVTNDHNTLFSSQPAITSEGKLTYTPADDAYGSATVTVILKDNGGTVNGGDDTASPITFTITIEPVNDIPSFDIKGAQTLWEDSGEHSFTNFATNISVGDSIYESEQMLLFTVTNDSNDLFTVQPTILENGTLTYTLADNAYGVAEVTVGLADNGGTANGGLDTAIEETFTITIHGINDSPTLDILGDQIINEDTGYQVVSAFVTNMTTGDESFENLQTLELVTTNDNNTLFALQPSLTKEGILTYTPADNAFGSATVTVTLTDNGGTENGGINAVTKTFDLTVNPVNDPPTFDKGADQIAFENGGTKTVEGWASNISKGPENEASQMLSFTVTTDNEDLFTTDGQPVIDASTGTLTYTPKAGNTGKAIVSVVLEDNGDTANGGLNTSEITNFNINVLTEGEFSIIGTIYEAESMAVIEGAIIVLTDLAGTEIATTTSNVTGEYAFTGVSEDQYIIDVSHPSYSQNERETEVSYEANALGVITEDFKMAEFTLELTANPTSILGNGIDTSTLTAKIEDKYGVAIEGVELSFDVSSGTLVGGSTFITDSEGEVEIDYRSELIEGTEEQAIPVTVFVDDAERNLYGFDRIYVTFAPGYIEGIVVDGSEDEAPVEGAIVKVYKDFDGDGIVDFSFTQTTKSDGKYKIAIPRGNVEYNIEITKPILIGDSEEMVTFKQRATVGDIEGTGDGFSSEQIATGVLVQKNSDGTASIMSDIGSSSSISIQIVNSEGVVSTITDSNINTDSGTWTTDSLSAGAYEIVVKYTFEGGQEIIIGTEEVTISETGEININQILIDPYGTITEEGTSEVIEGVYVKLYYADTENNIASGIVPNTLVSLPEIIGFDPSDNANPQYSDSNGNYAYMVYGDTDYYIVATKEGYKKHISETISVYDEIVLYDFELEKSSDKDTDEETEIETDSEINDNGEEKDLAIAISTDVMKVEETKALKVFIDYKNKSQSTVSDITITLDLPEGIQISSQTTGTQLENQITWTIDRLESGEMDQIELSLIPNEVEAGYECINLYAKIDSLETLSSLEDDASYIKALVYSPGFSEIHKRYIKGYVDGTFGADRNITRAEIATIFARLLDLDVESTTSAYTDVDSDHWAIGYIEAVTKEGLFGGYSDGTFAPDQGITRGELATIIARYLQIERNSSILPIQLHFTDIKNNWAMSSIEEIYRFQIIQGYGDDTFRPDNFILRSEAVTMINAMLYRGPLNVDISHFSDVEQEEWYHEQVEESAKTHEFMINPDGSETVIRWIDDEIK
jgi:VCBS repeat-containing protein